MRGRRQKRTLDKGDHFIRWHREAKLARHHCIDADHFAL